MIRDGRMPNPEDAQQQLDERLRRDRLGEPMDILQDDYLRQVAIAETKR
jgi:hypothetical protein